MPEQKRIDIVIKKKQFFKQVNFGSEPEFLFLCILKVVFNDRSTKETPGDLLVLPLGGQGWEEKSCAITNLLHEGVEVGDGVLDGGEGEESNEVSAVGGHRHNHKQPPEASQDSSENKM